MRAVAIKQGFSDTLCRKAIKNDKNYLNYIMFTLILIKATSSHCDKLFLKQYDKK